MAQPGGTKGIVSIPVDSSEFDAFLDKFMSYQKLLEDQPEVWRASSKGIKATKTAWDDVGASFDKVVRAAVADKFSSPTSGAFAKVQKSAKETERSWLSISREIEKAGKGMNNLVRSGLNFASLGIFGVGGGIIGALGTGAVEATNDLAKQNAENRQLGLGPGEEKAFSIEYGRAGGDAQLLAKIADAQKDPRKWNGLLASGITPAEIQTSDPEKLAAEFLQKAGAKFDSMGASAGTWAEQTGVTAFASSNALRQAGSYNANDYAQMAQKYDQLLPTLAAAQKTLDEATEEQAKFSAAFAKAELELEKAFVKIAPEFTELAGDAADWLKGFSDSGELAADMRTVGDAFKELAALLKKLGILNDDTAGKDSGLNPYLNGTADSGKSMGDVLAQRWPWLKAVQDFDDKYLSFGGGQQSNAPGDTPATKDNVLDAIRQNESSGINGKVNDKTGAAGLYGIMPANYKRDNINPQDPVAARAEAAKILDQQLQAYKGDLGKALGGYDGDTHIDADQQKYGDWIKGAPQETIDYLAKIERQGIDLKLPKEEQAWIDAHTTVKNGQKQKGGAVDPQIIAYDGGNPDDNVGGFPVVPYTGDDTPAASAGYKNIDGLNDIVSNLKTLLHNTVGEGAGANYRQSDRTSARIDRQGNSPQAPYQINVSVSTPAGSSGNVSAGGLPQ